MNNIRIARIGIGVVCIALGIFFFRFKTDQQFARLTPSEGSQYLISMKAGSSYEQDFLVHNKLISRFGLYLLPLHPLLGHTGTINVALVREGVVLQSEDIYSEFIDQTAPSEVQFARPVATGANEIMKLRVTVSDGISGDVALRNRIPDSDFSGEDIAFFIDGVQSEYPIAYTAFTQVNPAFIKQVGGLFILFGVALIGYSFFKKHFLLSAHIALISVAALQAISAYSSIVSPGLYFLLASCILIGIWWLLRIAGRSSLASIFGACTFALSSWLPLLLMTSGTSVQGLSMRNTLFDPNQIAVSHGAGAYIGFFAGFFAIVGICMWIYRRLRLELIVFVVAMIASLFAFVHTSIQIPRASIVVVFCIAWFASLGFHGMETLLGSRDRLVRISTALLVIIAILDFMHIAALTFAYGI